jgi:hypothetical protein
MKWPLTLTARVKVIDGLSAGGGTVTSPWNENAPLGEIAIVGNGIYVMAVLEKSVGSWATSDADGKHVATDSFIPPTILVPFLATAKPMSKGPPAAVARRL